MLSLETDFFSKKEVIIAPILLHWVQFPNETEPQFRVCFKHRIWLLVWPRQYIIQVMLYNNF